MGKIQNTESEGSFFEIYLFGHLICFEFRILRQRSGRFRASDLIQHGLLKAFLSLVERI